MFDKVTATIKRRKQRETLCVLRQMKRANNLFSQWDLISCGLQAVRYTAKYPHVWINSAIEVNLHPKYRIAFDAWSKTIALFMTTADSFDLVVQNNVDPYHILPSVW